LAPELETVHTGPAPTTAVRVQKAYDSGAARGRFVAKHGAAMAGPVESNFGLWARLVGLVATVCGRRSLVRLGKFADVVADYLPRYVAEKMISLLVEAAALSDRRRFPRMTAGLQNRKSL